MEFKEGMKKLRELEKANKKTHAQSMELEERGRKIKKYVEQKKSDPKNELFALEEEGTEEIEKEI